MRMMKATQGEQKMIREIIKWILKILSDLFQTWYCTTWYFSSSSCSLSPSDVSWGRKRDRIKMKLLTDNFSIKFDLPFNHLLLFHIWSPPFILFCSSSCLSFLFWKKENPLLQMEGIRRWCRKRAKGRREGRKEEEWWRLREWASTTRFGLQITFRS